MRQEETSILKNNLVFYKNNLRKGKNGFILLALLYLAAAFLLTMIILGAKSINVVSILVFVSFVIIDIVLGCLIGLVFYKYVSRIRLKEAYLKRKETEKGAKKAFIISSVIGFIFSGILLTIFKINGNLSIYLTLGVIAVILFGMLIPFILFINPYFGELALRKLGWITPDEKKWFDEWAEEIYKDYVENGGSNNSPKLRERIIEYCKTPHTRKEICDFLDKDNTQYNYVHFIEPLVADGSLSVTLHNEAIDSHHQKYCSLASNES